MNEITIMNATIPTFTNKALQIATNKVFRLGETARRCAYETAFIMASVDQKKCYEEDGFKSVHEWAMKTFGFKKSVSYRLLKIGNEYVRRIPDTKNKNIRYESNLLPENCETDFTASQIEKMLPGGHDLAVELSATGELNPSMTCKEIDKVIKAHTTGEEAEAESKAEIEAEAETEVENRPIVYRTVTDDNGNKYKIPLDILEQYKI